MMISEITKKVEALNRLKETAHNPKILIEEMRLVADKAFQLQEDILTLIHQAEENEENVAAIQSLFETREMVWDIIEDITTREMEIKEKTHTKKTCCQSKKTCNTQDKKCTHSDDTSCSDEHCCCHHKH